MSCNCLKELVKAMAKRSKVPVTNINIQEEMLIPAGRTCIFVDVMELGKTRKKTITVANRFCPICGNEYPKLK